MVKEDSIVEQKTWQVYCFGKRNVVQLYLNESKKKTVTHRHTYAHTHTHTHIYKHQSFTLVYQSDLLVGVGGGGDSSCVLHIHLSVYCLTSVTTHLLWSLSLFLFSSLQSHWCLAHSENWMRHLSSWWDVEVKCCGLKPEVWIVSL